MAVGGRTILISRGVTHLRADSPGAPSLSRRIEDSVKVCRHGKAINIRQEGMHLNHQILVQKTTPLLQSLVDQHVQSDPVRSSIAPLLVISGNNTLKPSCNSSSFPSRTTASVRTPRDSKSPTRTRSRSVHSKYISSCILSPILSSRDMPLSKKASGTQITTRWKFPWLDVMVLSVAVTHLRWFPSNRNATSSSFVASDKLTEADNAFSSTDRS